MASIRKGRTSNGTTYLVRVRRRGAPTQTATFTKRTDAKRWAHVMEGAITEGRHFPTSEAKRHTVNELIERYVRTVLPTKSHNHAYMQRQQLRWWGAQIGHYTLVDVTPALIVEYRDRLCLMYGPATVTRYLAALSHAFTTAAREWGWCDDNPVRRVTRPREPKGRVRFLSDDERQRLMTSCKASHNPYLYTVVVLALSTGARKMELLSLTWRDVDLKRGVITLQDTKNGDRRTLHLTGLALQLMHQHATLRRIDTALVFPAPDGRKPARIREAWDTTLRRANITDFRFHDLRHTAASYLAMNGASLMELAEILGHKTLSMVKRYAHLSDQHTRGVVERMNRAVFGE